MFYLVLSIIFNSWWALSYKIAINKGSSASGMTTVACGTAFIFLLFWKLLASPAGFNYLSAVVGVTAGIGLFVAMASYFALISSGVQLGITWTIITLSMVIPTAFSIFLWQEIPTHFQILGLAFVVASIYMLGQGKSKSRRLTGTQLKLLLLAFVSTGWLGLSSKLISVLDPGYFKLTYLCFLYGGAFVLALSQNFTNKRLPRVKEIKFGVGMGIAGVGGLLFLLLALKSLTGTLAFPLRTCGIILLVVFVTYFVWHERIGRSSWDWA